jgi:hypothetical protein
MKELVKEAKDLISDKYKVLTTQQSDEPLTHEFKEEQMAREKKENPTVSREEELENIRSRHVEKNIQAKESLREEGDGKEVETILGNVNDQVIGVVHTVHDFVGGESRSEQLSHVRQRKIRSRGIER